ncbi:MAG: hypothetical protein IJN95_01705 [Clostridia bacterium]|nr:hypothetical protein [Clostridia bacterium]
MNKKQLRIQNASFLAELERKVKEIEILNIRLEKAEQDFKNLANEKEDLINLAKELEAKNQELAEKIIALDAALEAANAKLEMNEAISSALSEVTEEPYEVDEESCEVDEGSCEVNEEPTDAEPTEPNAPITEIDFEIKQKIEQIDALTVDNKSSSEVIEEPANSVENFSNNIETPSPVGAVDTVKPEAEYSGDFLRDYGAKIIARVTRATAEVIARASVSNEDVSKSLKTLALGKNESFKYQVMELTKQKDAPQKAVEEMDLLAEETIVYLKSI